MRPKTMKQVSLRKSALILGPSRLWEHMSSWCEGLRKTLRRFRTGSLKGVCILNWLPLDKLIVASNDDDGV